MKETELVIEGVEFPKFSTRRATEKIEPIQAALLERTINGELIDLIPKSHHKYRLTITCQEKNAPSFFQAGIGRRVFVCPISLFWEHHRLDKAGLSLNLKHKAQHIIIQNKSQNFKERTFEFGEDSKLDLGAFAEIGDELLCGYRPVLEMVITKFSYQTEEWSKQDKTAWMLTLEEI